MTEEQDLYLDTISEAPRVSPMPLRLTAGSIAAQYGDRGAIVITSGDEGIRIGVHGLDARELQDALCVAVYHAVAKTLV